MKALLLLEDGTLFEGTGFGGRGEAFGEVVFNTSITGYQEILTDPSYRGQIVTMTFPQIGNYGVTGADRESSRTWLAGFVVKELSAIASNWRATGGLDAFLAAGGVVGIQGIDTRALARHLRVHGAKHGIISTIDMDPASLARKLAAAPRIVGVDLVREVTCDRPYEWSEPVEGRPVPPAAPGGRRQVVVLDCGVKFNILRNLVSTGFRVTVVPASTAAEAVLALKPDGVLLSNGPGDPEPVSYVVETVRTLIGRVPLFGICLGHQMLALALGGRTYKLKFGHHGGNHPVKDLKTGRIAITSQNHGFNVDMRSLEGSPVRATHVNLYDGTVEGLEDPDRSLFGVQYHPEAGPGPHDADRLFARFADLVAARGG